MTPRRARGRQGAKGPPAGMRPVRILVADDHEIVRCGVRGLLESNGYEVVAEASNGNEAVERAVALDPDIAIIDITMPRLNGIEAARRLRQLAPRTEVLILSMHQSEQLVREVLEAGARGYMLKADAAKHLTRAVEALALHRPYFTAEVSQRLLDAYLARAEAKHAERQPGGELTPREREIVQLLAEGKSNKETATLLNLSVKTVETHRSNLMRKLGLHGLSDLIHYALRNNLIDH
jgi:DNA-binding NarL/FixJ family response regulator